MKNRTRIVSALAAPALLVPLMFTRPAAAATPTLATCAGLIEKDGLSAQGDIIKALQSCDKGYRKDLSKGAAHYNSVSGKSSGFASAAACEKQLSGVLGLSSTKGQGKWKNDLAKNFAAKCTDTTLLLLGHLPSGPFGDTWQRYVVMTSLQKAYNQEIELARDTVNMFLDMGNDPVNSCPSCKLLATSPCYEHACNYVTAGSSGFDNLSDTVGDIPGNLVGSSAFTLCKFKDVNPAGTYLVTGATSKGLQPVNVGGIAFACPLTLGAEGYVSCTGTLGKVNYKTCQDSDVASLTDNQGGCTAAISPDVCEPASVDAANGGFNGGACTKYSSGGAQPGAAFIINTTQLNTVLNIGAQLGPDGLPCTDDDAGTIAPPGSIGLTSGSSDTQVLNTTAGTVVNGPDSGAAFNCGTNGSIIQSSNLSGAKIAGAFPTLSAATLNDSAVTFHIACQ